jgi:hypothetical protein
VESHSSGGFLVPELVIPGGKPILTVDSTSMSWWFPADSLFIPWRASVGSPRTKLFQWIPRLWSGNSRQNHYFSRGGRVLAIRGRKILRMVKSRIPSSEGSLQRKHNFLKLKHENAIKMKNKPYPALLRPSILSNEVKKGIKISWDYPFKELHNFLRLRLGSVFY